MKKIDITSQISGIDPKFIEEAVNHKVKRISSVRVVAIAACLAILVTSIPLALIMSRHDETEPPKATESETTKPNDQNVIPPEQLRVVYCDSSELDSMKEIADKAGLEVEIKDSQAIKEKEKIDTKIEDITGVPSTLNVEILGREYVCYLDKDSIFKNYWATDCDVEFFHKFAYEARYYTTSDDLKDEDKSCYDRLSVTYNFVTGKITDIVFYDLLLDKWKEIERDDPKEYTQEQLVDMAHDFVESFWPDLTLTWDSQFEVIPKDKDGLYMIIFKQTVFGIPTGQSIGVLCTIYGEMLTAGKSVHSYDLFDCVLANISEEQINGAKKIALELLNGRKLLDLSLNIYLDGKLYLNAYYEEHQYHGIVVEIT